MDHKSIKLLAAVITAASICFPVICTKRKSTTGGGKSIDDSDSVMNHKNCQLEDAQTAEEDNRPESTVLVGNNPHEYRWSYDLKKYQDDTYQVGYELTKLIKSKFSDILEDGTDYIRFDGSKVLTDRKYYEIHFDGKYRANLIFHQINSQMEDEISSIFYSEYMKEYKRDDVKASLCTNKHVVINKGTYKSFADLLANLNGDSEELSVMKIQLGKLRFEDIIDIMSLFKTHDYLGVLMY